MLKNAIDWGARPFGTSVWPGKPGFITGTSPGAIGTALVQANLRTVMLGLGMTLLGGESYVQFKPNLFDEAGNITDETTQKFLQGFRRPVRDAGDEAEGVGARRSSIRSSPRRRGPSLLLVSHFCGNERRKIYIPSGPRVMATTPVRDTSTRPTGSIRLTKLSILSDAPVISNTKLSVVASMTRARKASASRSASMR